MNLLEGNFQMASANLKSSADESSPHTHLDETPIQDRIVHRLFPVLARSLRYFRAGIGGICTKL